MKIAIIGASEGQLPLCRKAKELGIEVILFAWEQGAICKEYADKFYPISIFEKEKILNICIEEKIEGILSNASDKTVSTVAFISEKMRLHGLPLSAIEIIADKSKVRNLTNNIKGLSIPKYFVFKEKVELPYPLIVKPITSSAKRGLSFVESDKEFFDAVEYARKELSDCEILVEEYIIGIEISVESISYEGKHYIIQITDKENTGAPHFVEIGHHQPSLLNIEIKKKLKCLVSCILTNLNYSNGASHSEFKISDQGDIYLIEVNPRGGGDQISNKLVYLSTGYDYLRGMIDVSLGKFATPHFNKLKYSGIYFLCKQVENRLSSFKKSEGQPWLIEKTINSYNYLHESSTNYGRDGYFIYQWEHKILLDYENQLDYENLKDE